MIIRSRIVHSVSLFVLAASVSLISGRVGAQAVPSPMNLSRAPLFLNASVDPNVAVTLDDSGSMRWGFMPDRVDAETSGIGVAVCGWRHPRYYSHVFNTLYYNPGVRYTPPLGPTGAPFRNADFNAAWYDGYEAVNVENPGNNRQGSAVINLGTQFYPTRDYVENQANATPGTRVGHDPRLRPEAPVAGATNAATADTWRTDCTNPTNASVPTPVPPVLGGGSVAVLNGNAWLPFTSAHNQTTGTFYTGQGGTSSAFYYRFTGDPAVVAQINDPRRYDPVKVADQSADQRTNFANWYSYYRTRVLLARTALTRAFAVQDQGMQVVYQNLTENAFNPGTTLFNKFTGAPRTAFFNQVYRSRAPFVTPNFDAMIRAGRLFQFGNGVTDSRNPYWEGPPLSRELTCRQNFHVHVTDGTVNQNNAAWPAAPTARPNVNGVLPDGKTLTVGDASSRVIWNIAPLGAAPCGTAQRCSPTLADIAYAYWATDLRPDALMTNNVPPFWSDLSTGITGPSIVGPIPNPAVVPEIYWNPANNPATWQHMVNYTVGLGVAGVNVWPGDLTALRTGAAGKIWPGSVRLRPQSVDDLWHAGVVSRGGFYSAADPQQLVDSLSEALTSVVARRGSAAAAAVTSGIIQASTLVFRTGFDSGDWSGQVNAFKVDSLGVEILPRVWEAGELLTLRDPNSRVIITSADHSGGGVPFRWGSLPLPYQASLHDDPSTSIIDNDLLGERRVQYIRGDRGFEVNNGGSFRIRNSLLGAVVNSGAVVVAAPSAAFTDEDFPGGPEQAALVKYSQFRIANRNRDRVIYVGANDGMLHAFDAGTGVTGFDAGGNPIIDFGTGAEKWAYVPREVAPTLSRMTNPTFEFTPYVDSTPAVRDVFIGASWRTLLVGSLRRGGQGIFALDVTNPNVDETALSASSVVLWEFSDDVAGGGRMGFTYGRPNISRLANGRWVVIVPASYNSEQDTASEPQVAPADPALPSGGSTLFVLDAANGAIIRQFDFTPAESRGLTAPTMGDYESDFIDEFAVAGDLQGNLWRFDLSSPLPAAWSRVKMFNPATPFAQPITSAPRLFPDAATGGIIVVVGTGKYLEPGDRSVVGTFTQSLYGIRDYRQGPAPYPILRTQLVGQTLTKTPGVPPAPSTFRVTNNTFAATSRGWAIDLVDAGERAVTSPGALFSQGIGIFSTIIPNGDDPCEPGLRGNVFVLNAASGAAPAMDFNDDGLIDTADESGTIGQSILKGISEGTPALLINAGGGLGTLVDFRDLEIRVPTTVWRRQSWREITP